MFLHLLRWMFQFQSCSKEEVTVKKETKSNKLEVCTLRESIRDQKYPKGFMQPDFPEMTEAGIAHSKHLETPIPMYDRAPRKEQWSRIKGTRCIVRKIDAVVKVEEKEASRK